MQATQKAYGELLHAVKALGDNRTKTEQGWQLRASDAATTLASKVQDLANIARDSSSSSLNDLLQAVAAALSLGPAKEFLRSLRICATCRNFERAGGLHDGGYVMCADGLSKSGLAGAYSYGIGGEDRWGVVVAQRYEVPLFQYDCLDTREPKSHRGVEAKFAEECIQGNDERQMGPYATLSEQLRRNGQAVVRNSSLLLKLDVEGAEYDVLSQETAATLAKFRQINLELHNINHEAHDPRSLKAMRTLIDAGFAVVHLHGNNHEGQVHMGPYSVPKVLEVTLIRQTPETRCQAHAPRRLPEDSPCSLDRDEVPLPKLPK